MNKTLHCFTVFFSFILILVFASSLQSQATYVGSDQCKTCHPTHYDEVFTSGHPFKIQKVNGAPPTYPMGTSPGVPNPPVDLANGWDDVSYVIGGFNWKARFMDSEGFILTGDTDRQYNLANDILGLDANWSGYSASTAPRKPYTCGSCHTTGWVDTDEEGPHQDDLPGIYGTWEEPGIGCEGCHGAGSDHVAAPSKTNITKVENCGTCHSRGDINMIDVKGGLIRHHEQAEDLLASPHDGACGTCHDPHKSTVYEAGGFKGQAETCETCHADIAIQLPAKADFKCIDCHMPYAGKSAVAITVDYDGGSVGKGDIKTHIFSITDDPAWNMFNDDSTFVRKDANGKAHITVDFACLTCHTDENKAWAIANAPNIHAVQPTVAFAGSDACKPCHQSQYDDVFMSGHPFKIQKVDGGPPSYPAGTSAGVPDPPVDLVNGWDDVTYVIGGYNWKARFMDSEGFILTGSEDRQYNLANTELGLDSSWTGYSASTAPRKPYTCGTCHTTGWIAGSDEPPHQDDLPGIYGTWAEPGIGCEGCHGAGALHAAGPTKLNISKAENCSRCHARGDIKDIDVKGGLIRHHEQAEGLLASPHTGFDCSSCHDPHKSTVYEKGGFLGQAETCETCHSDIAINIPAKVNFECSSCHMPFAAKSAVGIMVDYDGGSVGKGDIRTHIFAINDDASYNMFTDDGKFVRKDTEGKAFISLDFACMTCHTSKDLQWAATNAMSIHGPATSVPTADADGTLPETYALHQNYPNPFNPGTTIPFDLPESSVVDLKLYNSLGQEVATLMNERLPAGNHTVSFNADDLPSGIYIYRITTKDFAETKKMILLK